MKIRWENWSEKDLFWGAHWMSTCEALSMRDCWLPLFKRDSNAVKWKKERWKSFLREDLLLSQLKLHLLLLSDPTPTLSWLYFSVRTATVSPQDMLGQSNKSAWLRVKTGVSCRFSFFFSLQTSFLLYHLNTQTLVGRRHFFFICLVPVWLLLAVHPISCYSCRSIVTSNSNQSGTLALQLASSNWDEIDKVKWRIHWRWWQAVIGTKLRTGRDTIWGAAFHLPQWPLACSPSSAEESTVALRTHLRVLLIPRVKCFTDHPEQSRCACPGERRHLQHCFCTFIQLLHSASNCI